MPTKTAKPKRFQCRHIFTGGHRCGSPALKQELFCFYHHTSRKPVPKSEAQARKGRRAEFTLPRPEDRSAIQHSIGEVLLRIADHGIDARRAGLLLYGLQIAAINLPKQNPKAEPAHIVEEVIEHPTFGPIAPRPKSSKIGPKTAASSAVSSTRSATILTSSPPFRQPPYLKKSIPTRSNDS